MSWEGSNSATELILPERALVSRRFGDKRDLGIKVDKKLGNYFYYSLGLFNGQGLNHLDKNNQKDAALRLEVYPMDGIMVGGVAYTSIGQRNLAGTKDRLEGDVRLSLHNVLLQAEYIWGRDKLKDNFHFQRSHGMYGAVGYTLFDKLQPVFRVGFLDPNLSASNDRTTAYEGGVNYYFQGKQMKLQASFSVFHPQQGANSREGILAAQVTF